MKMKPQISIEEFCNKHDACHDGRAWALKHCQTMHEAWNTAQPDWVIWIATREGVLSELAARLFAAYCARSCQTADSDPRSIAAIDCAERFAKGEATSEELAAARFAARFAAESAAESSAVSAARFAADSAADSAAESAAWSAAESAARSAARFAARSAAESRRMVRRRVRTSEMVAGKHRPKFWRLKNPAT